MRTQTDVDHVMALTAAGLSDAEISRRTDVPRSTVRGWRQGTQRVMGRAREYDRTALPRAEYAYLLGLYLGDGHIARHPRDVFRLRLFLDERYSNIIMWCIDALRAVMPHNRVHVHFKPGCAVISSYSTHWPALLPQHGPGRKHARPIALAAWQTDIVDGQPEAFVRGLIHSDGSRFVNRVSVRGKAYAYPRYTFTNTSADIRALFTRSCDRLGIAWRVMNPTNISVARRDAVARLDAFVGPKR